MFGTLLGTVDARPSGKSTEVKLKPKRKTHGMIRQPLRALSHLLAGLICSVEAGNHRERNSSRLKEWTCEWSEVVGVPCVSYGAGMERSIQLGPHDDGNVGICAVCCGSHGHSGQWVLEMWLHFNVV